MKLRPFPRLRKARAENHCLHEIIKYQNGRMRDMAAESLGMQARLAQLAPPRRPSTVDTVVMDRVVS